MKKIIISLTITLTIIYPLSSLAITFTPQEISGIVKITSYLAKESIDSEIRSLRGVFTDDELADYRKQLQTQEYSGTGFMVTYSGCVLTNKHVVYDEATSVAHQDIHLWSTNDITKEPENLGKASIAYMRTLDDIAIVCLDNTKGRFFNRIFIKTDDYNDLTLNLGEEIYTLGYPASGAEYLTLNSGLVAGVWDKDTLKTDMAITDGASGSPVFNGNKQVVGIARGNTGLFDQLGLFLKPSFVIDWHEGYKQVYRELLPNMSAGCMDTEIRGIYQKNGQEYYDLACTIRRNYGLEDKLAFDYQNYCHQELRLEDGVAAASYIADGRSTINHWSAYLEATCLAPSIVSVFEY